MKEFFSGATYYGIGKVIKKYAFFPSFLPCPVSIQHGWTTLAVVHDAQQLAAENWYWSAELENQYQEKFEGLQTRTVGAPFLYLLRKLKYQEPSEKTGSIVFPSHSSSLVEVTCDFDKYASMLAGLPDKYKPVTVCMYYLDIEKGLDEPFRKKGFDIVCNGDNLYDASFLRKFIENTHGKKYAFSNQMTSALLFASSLGLTSFFYGPDFQTNSTDPNYEHLDYTNHHRSWETQYSRYFKFPDCDVFLQKEVVSKELGKTNLLSPLAMGVILYTSILKKEYLRLLIVRAKAWVANNMPLVFKFYSGLKRKARKITAVHKENNCE